MTPSACHMYIFWTHLPWAHHTHRHHPFPSVCHAIERTDAQPDARTCLSAAHSKKPVILILALGSGFGMGHRYQNLRSCGGSRKPPQVRRFEAKPQGMCRHPVPKRSKIGPP